MLQVDFNILLLIPSGPVALFSLRIFKTSITSDSVIWIYLKSTSQWFSKGGNSKVDQAEQYSRRNNLRISGYVEDNNENTDDIVMKMASDIGCDLQLSEIDRSHRVGKPDAARTKQREILVKFTSYRARQKLYKRRTELKDKGYNGVFLNEDLTKLRSKVLFEARKVVKADCAKGAWSSDGNILIKDYGDVVHRLTSDDDLNDIDFPAKPEPPAPEPMD